MIEVFPERVLDSSIHIAIYTGILVLWVATETIGWAFTGFVVVGYLAAIALVEPGACITILWEAILTHGLASAINRLAPFLGVSHRLFGRERFLIYILCSIPVRILVEVYSSGGLKNIIDQYIPALAHYQLEFHSIGLVLVPLLANSFWKPGLAKGLLQTGTGTLATGAILAFIISPLTNYHLGALDVAFDSVALDFLASPKLYIVLLSTAFIAAHNNVRYGWDFNGILIPALLAILAIEPFKAIVTVVESVILALVYLGFIRLPFIRDINLEGPRKLVTMYSLSLFLKFGIATIAQTWFPLLHISDLFGFGYLLTSLIAVKCVQKRQILRIMMPTVATAIQGSLVGRGLALVFTLFVTGEKHSQSADPGEARDTHMNQSVLSAVIRIRDDFPSEQIWPAETVLTQLSGHLQDSTPDELYEQFLKLPPSGLVASWTTRSDGTRCLHLTSPRNSLKSPEGIPALWWCGGAGPGLVISPEITKGSGLWATAFLAQNLTYSGMIIPGQNMTTDPLGKMRVLRSWIRARRLLGEIPSLVLWPSDTDQTELEPLSSHSPTSFPRSETYFPDLAVRFVHIPDDVKPLMGPNDSLFRLSSSSLEARITPKRSPPDTRMYLESKFARFVTRNQRMNAFSRSLEERLSAAKICAGEWIKQADNSAPSSLLPYSLKILAESCGFDALGSLDPDGLPVWILDGSRSGWGILGMRPGRASAWNVLVPLAADQQGTSQIALHHFFTLKSRSIYLTNLATHTIQYSFGDALGPIHDQAPADTMIVREILRNTPDSELRPYSTLLVLAQPPLSDEAGDLVLSTGAEIHPGFLEIISEELAPVLKPWASLDFVNGQASVSALVGSHWFPYRYLERQNRSGAISLWYSTNRLADTRGHPDRTQLLSALTGLGIKNRSIAPDLELTRLFPESYRYPAQLPALDDLNFSIQTGSLAPLKKLVNQGIRIEVLTTPIQLIWIAKTRKWMCLVTGFIPRDSPHKNPLTHSCRRKST